MVLAFALQARHHRRAFDELKDRLIQMAAEHQAQDLVEFDLLPPIREDGKVLGSGAHASVFEALGSESECFKRFHLSTGVETISMEIRILLKLQFGRRLLLDMYIRVTAPPPLLFF